MASLRGKNTKTRSTHLKITPGSHLPFQAMAKQAAPQALQQALRFVFSQVKEGTWLVGGTALSLYYANYRRSDDLDLFTATPLDYDLAVRAVKNLTSLGATLISQMHTPAYYRAVLSWQKHTFTADVVLDERVHAIGHAHHTKDGVWVADLDTSLS